MRSPILLCTFFPADHGETLPLRFSTILSDFQLTATVKLTKTDEKTIRTILASCLWPHLFLLCDPEVILQISYTIAM